jgi:hypothetical protein
MESYERLSLLGKGGYGKVYHVMENEYNFAMKIVAKNDKDADKVRLEGFLLE